MASKDDTRRSSPRKRGAATSTAADPNEVRERHLKKLRP